MGQERSSTCVSSTRFISPKQSQSILSTFEHESFLKLRKTPFKNSVKIMDSPLLFLQNIDTTLSKLLSERFGGTKLFTQQDIIKIIQTCLYGLAHLQNNGVIYPDLTTDNIFYDTQQGGFKLLPIDLIDESSYSLVLAGKKFRNLPPELILALRMQEQDVQQDTIFRSNVFMLGMILLEVCTLRSSSECYDDDNFDILDKAIQQRLSMVKEFYPSKISQLLSLMLQYDYTKRLTAEQLSTLVNEQITLQRNKKKQIHQNLTKPTVKVKQIEEDPRFYRPSPSFIQPEIQTRISHHKNQQPLQNITQYKNIYQPQIQYNQKPQFHQKSRQTNPYQNYQNQNRTPKKNSVQYPQYYQYQKRQPRQSQSPYKQQSVSPTSQPYPYQQTSKSNCLKQFNAGSKYPSIIYQTDFNTKQNKYDSGQSSLCRIKQQIQRSRKRIQQFNKLDHVGRFGK